MIQDRHVVGMGFRPGADLLEAVGEQGADRPIIDVRDVDHLHPGLGHVGEVVGRGVGGHLAAERARIAAALRVVHEVQFELPRSVVQLLGQRRVAVVEGIGGLGIAGAQVRHLQGRDRHLVAVVAAHGLQLVHLQRIDRRARAARLAGGMF
jgi:hypothetical protein